MIALLVRHGQTVSTREGRFLGSEDIPLDEVGMAQAAATREAIAAFGPDAVIHSPMLRSCQTLELLAPEGLATHADERLTEVDFGNWEGLRPEEVAAADPDGKRRFDSGDMVRFPGGETSAEAALRVSAAITAMVGQADHLLVVGHNTALRLGLAQLIGVEPRRYRRTLATLRPCHWAEVRLSADSQAQLISYNTNLVAPR
ncbi:MAG: histidine phosphatase family protein [Chloroflexota bacterium]